MLMANTAPPAPPPYQPGTPSNNPYDFITNPPESPKRGLFSGGSKNQRVLLIGGLATVLLTIGVLIAAVLSSSDSGVKQDYLSLIQQQAEIVRISEIGEETAHDTTAKNLAITTKLSVSSDHAATLAIAKKAGAPTDIKSIALGKNDKVDALLTDAEQVNQFDEVFIKTMDELLSTYQQLLKKLYNQSTNPDTKKTLQHAYNNALLLTAQEQDD